MNNNKFLLKENQTLVETKQKNRLSRIFARTLTVSITF